MKISYIYWKDGEFWIGYLDEYPDYMTQGATMEEFKENLKDLFDDLSSGKIPYARKKGQLEIA